MTDIKYIKGPLKITEWYSSQFDMHIYSIGEEHEKKDVQCNDNINNREIMGVSDYLEEIVKANPDKIIDIFLETEYTAKGYNNFSNFSLEDHEKYSVLLGVTSSVEIFYNDPEYQKYRSFNLLMMDLGQRTFQYGGNGYIDDIYHKFENCFALDKNKCHYKNLRTHYSDFRFCDSFFDKKCNYRQQITYLVTKIAWAVIGTDNKKVFDILIKHKSTLITIYTDFINLITNISNNDDLIFIKQIELFDHNNKIKKQFNAINKEQDSFLKQKIINELGKIYNVTIKEYIEKCKILLSKLKSLNNFDILEMYDIKDNIIYLRDPTIGLLDIYMLGRMFRSFENGPDPKHIITYAGDFHTNTQEQIYKLLGFVKINYTGYESHKNIKVSPSGIKCLDISKFNKPFFSVKPDIITLYKSKLDNIDSKKILEHEIEVLNNKYKKHNYLIFEEHKYPNKKIDITKKHVVGRNAKWITQFIVPDNFIQTHQFTKPQFSISINDPNTYNFVDNINCDYIFVDSVLLTRGFTKRMDNNLVKNIYKQALLETFYYNLNSQIYNTHFRLRIPEGKYVRELTEVITEFVRTDKLLKNRFFIIPLDDLQEREKNNIRNDPSLIKLVDDINDVIYYYREL